MASEKERSACKFMLGADEGLLIGISKALDIDGSSLPQRFRRAS
jgi:hypothetical protein